MAKNCGPISKAMGHSYDTATQTYRPKKRAGKGPQGQPPEQEDGEAMAEEAPVAGKGIGSMAHGMHGKSMKPGGGGRFAALKGKLAHQKGVTNPGALAASIGRKKYGAKKFNAMSH
jgi:hypothetical protein